MEIRCQLCLDPHEKDEYIDLLLYLLRVVDGFWFLGVERRFGLDSALELDEDIWERIGARTAKKIKLKFKIQSGLVGLAKALRYEPWAVMEGFRMAQLNSKLKLWNPDCGIQKARLRLGLGEFPCKQVGLRYMRAFASEIDSRIQVRCAFAPPDPHPPDCYCAWEFWVE